MNFIKKYNTYILIIVMGILVMIAVGEITRNNYDNNKEELKSLAAGQMNNNVEALINEINQLRIYNDDETVKKIIHDEIEQREVYRNEYIWINEINNYEGGDDYATVFVNPNVPATEGEKRSTNNYNSRGENSDLEELTGLNKDGEIYYSFYFKSYSNNTEEYKYSYVKLYKDYNWAIGCGIPETDLYRSADDAYEQDKVTLYMIDLIVIIIIFLACMLVKYYEKLRNKENEMRISDAKSQSKTEFLSILSHEMRTPLNAIIGLNDLIEDNVDKSDAVLEYSYKIDEASQILLSTINDTLDMAAIENGKFKLENKEFSVTGLIRPLVKLYDSLAEKKNLEFKLKEESITEDVLVGDRYRIRQILLNLLSNAYKFTESGSIEINIQEKEIDETKVSLIIEVKDTGCGMKSEFMSNLYDEFTQADASVVRKYGGSGLGLSITKNIVDHMNGTINVKSELNRGSCFIVSLPMEIYSGNDYLEIEDDAEEDVSEKILEGKKVLLVEDNDINRMIIRKMVVSFGAETEEANNGQKAIEIMKKENNIDLILMDIMMPVMDGLTASKEIRKLNRDVIIIALSANAFKEDIEKSQAAGMNCHLSKPVRREKLHKVINEQLKK